LSGLTGGWTNGKRVQAIVALLRLISILLENRFRKGDEEVNLLKYEGTSCRCQYKKDLSIRTD
jgi:hypothetical protein